MYAEFNDNHSTSGKHQVYPIDLPLLPTQHQATLVKSE